MPDAAVTVEGAGDDEEVDEGRSIEIGGKPVRIDGPVAEAVGVTLALDDFEAFFVVPPTAPPTTAAIMTIATTTIVMIPFLVR